MSQESLTERRRSYTRWKSAGRRWPIDRDPMMFETTVPGVFAAGDVRATANRRIAAGVGVGSGAIVSLHHYFRRACRVQGLRDRSPRIHFLAADERR